MLDVLVVLVRFREVKVVSSGRITEEPLDALKAPLERGTQEW
jgi:hypothetical protein